MKLGQFCSIHASNRTGEENRSGVEHQKLKKIAHSFRAFLFSGDGEVISVFVTKIFGCVGCNEATLRRTILMEANNEQVLS
jgi:hypothetical protein